MESPWGQDDLDNRNKASKAKQQEELARDSKLYATVFNNPDGKKVLEKLKKVLDGPTWDPNKEDKFGYYREGQNSIIRHIFTNIEKAKKI